MLCLIYQFKVKPGRDEHFREGWRSLTETIAREHGSYGARLHKATDGTWISYAEWPDPELWHRGDEFINEYLKETHWDECLESVHLLLQMTATDDLLRPASVTP